MRFPLLLVMARGYHVSISTIGKRGRVQCTDSGVLVWSNCTAHLSQECQEEVVFSLSVSQNPVSITSTLTGCILKLTQTKKNTQQLTCTQQGVHKIWACNHSKNKICICEPPWTVRWLTANQETCRIHERFNEAVVMSAAFLLQRGRKEERLHTEL